MRSLRCTFNAATALHRIFIAPIEHSNLCTGPHPLAYSFPKLHIPRGQRYLFSSSRKLEQLPRDGDIDSKRVRIVLENGKLSPPQYTANVRMKMNTRTETLIAVAKADKSDPSSMPICKIVSIAALKKAEYEKNKSKKASAAQWTIKKIELNWAIDGHDLRHRLERVQEFLAKGWRVEVLMAPKRKGRRATEEEARQLVAKVKETVNLVEGAREWKGMEGVILGQATMYLEGAPQNQRSAE
jgi:translation initiation factor IF-3